MLALVLKPGVKSTTDLDCHLCSIAGQPSAVDLTQGRGSYGARAERGKHLGPWQAQLLLNHLMTGRGVRQSVHRAGVTHMAGHRGNSVSCVTPLVVSADEVSVAAAAAATAMCWACLAQHADHVSANAAAANCCCCRCHCSPRVARTCRASSLLKGGILP